MNATSTGTGEISGYLDAVREALADLPPAERDELLEDLPGHLAEVAAETGQPLVERLGPPERYAAELCAAAGLTPSRHGMPRPLAVAMRRLTGLLSTIDTRLGPLVGYQRLGDFGGVLRPAWWVLRGYLLALVLAKLLDPGSPGLLPTVDGHELAGLLLVLGFVVGSIWVGRRSAGLSPVLRRLIVVAGLAIVFFSLPVLRGIDDFSHQGTAGSGGGYPVDSFSNVRDVFPYGSDGQPLRGVRLYDQNGNPIQIGDPWRCRTQEPGPEPAYAYPLCGVGYPLASVPPGQTHSPVPSASPPPSPAPS